MRIITKKCISLLLVISFVICILPTSALAAKENHENSWLDKLTGRATNTVENISNSANSTIDSAKQVISKLSVPDFRAGWKQTASFFGTTVASLGGRGYVSDIADAIDELQQNVNMRVQYYGSDIAQKAGFAAEEWHAGTYNIDAIVRGIEKVAATEKSSGMGSVDVSVGEEVSASLKFDATAERSVREQAKNYLQKYNEYASKSKNPLSQEEWFKKNHLDIDDNSELFWSIYKDQTRVIPKDQLEAAKVYLEKVIAIESSKDGENRSAVRDNYKETLNNLSDRIKTADGTESIPLSKKEAEAIAKAGADNGFKPSEFGISTEKVIKPKYIAKQAMKAGASSAIIESAVVLGPQIFEIIKHLADTGELNLEQVKSSGIDGLSAAADGYLKGSISNAIVVMCNSGKLGATYTSASPELIGAMTVLVIDAIRLGITMANGKLSVEKYTDIMAQEVVVSVASLSSAALVGSFFSGAAVAVCIGSFVGGLIASAGYPIGKTYALAIINDSNVDLLVPIKNTSAAISDKKEMLSSKISDSLANIKLTDNKNVKDKVIEVFDFTTK